MAKSPFLSTASFLITMFGSFSRETFHMALQPHECCVELPLYVSRTITRNP